MRDVVKQKFSRDVNCHQRFTSLEPIPGVPMLQAVQKLTQNERKALMFWMTRGGPFWDDPCNRKHPAEDWLECRGDLVTDSAIGEAAYRALNGVECGLVSAAPSNWNYSPVEVIWRRQDEGLDDQSATLENLWDTDALEARLQEAPPPIESWVELESSVRNQFTRLTFADSCFEPLEGVPFVGSTAKRIPVLLNILDQLAGAFDEKGTRTPEGHKISQDYFVGENALFSDSSDTEKQHFKDKLTFPHPEDPKESLFCTWHGKARHRQFPLRLHFSTPIRAKEPIYVVYVGPKITMQ